MDKREIGHAGHPCTLEAQAEAQRQSGREAREGEAQAGELDGYGGQPSMHRDGSPHRGDDDGQHYRGVVRGGLQEAVAGAVAGDGGSEGWVNTWQDEETFPAMPSIDAFHFSLSAVLYDLYLCKRVYATVPPSPAEVLVLAMAVGLSLAALAWWNTPGDTYLPYRPRLLFFFRMYHLLACSIVPCSGVFVVNTTPWKDFAHVMLSPGFSGGNLLLQATIPLSFHLSLLVNAMILPFVFTEAYQICNLPFMEPLREQMAAALRVLQHPAMLRPLRGKLSGLSARGECHVVLGTSYFLGALALPACLAVEGWTWHWQRDAEHAGDGGGRSPTQGAATSLSNNRLLSWWLRQPFSVRLPAYLVTLQLAAVLAVAVGSLVAG